MYSRNTSGKTDIQRGEFKSYADKLPPGYAGSRFSRIKENTSIMSDSSPIRERTGMQGGTRTAKRYDSGERNAAIRKYEETLPTYSTERVRRYVRSGIAGSDSFIKAQRELEDRAHERAAISEELLRIGEENDNDNCDCDIISENYRDKCTGNDECEDTDDKCGDKSSTNIFQSLGELFKNEVGREDMLLCALLLLFLTEGREDCGEIVVILALLLALR